MEDGESDESGSADEADINDCDRRWKQDSIDLRLLMQVPDGPSPWFATAALAGVPNVPRYKECIALAFWAGRRRRSTRIRNNGAWTIHKHFGASRGLQLFLSARRV